MEQLDQHSQGCTTLPSALETNHSTDKGWNQFYERLDLAPTPKKWEMIGQGRSVAESWITYKEEDLCHERGVSWAWCQKQPMKMFFVFFEGPQLLLWAEKMETPSYWWYWLVIPAFLI